MKKLDKNELVETLEELLAGPRSKLREQGFSTPSIKVGTMDMSSAGIAHPEVFVLETSFHPNDCDVEILLRKWATLLKLSPKELDNTMTRFHSFYQKPSAMFFPVRGTDGSSIAIRRTINRNSPKMIVSLFKDYGFDRAELAPIVAGYAEGFSNRKPVTGSDSKIISELPDLQTFVDEIFGGEFGSRFPGAASATRPPSPASPSSSGDPLEELRSLGVEVFDKTNNAMMTWDRLAGYDSVKQNIQVRVIGDCCFSSPCDHEVLRGQTRRRPVSVRMK